MEHTISHVIYSILAVLMTLDLVTIAFATMQYLCNAIMHFVFHILDSYANVPELKKAFTRNLYQQYY